MLQPRHVERLTGCDAPFQLTPLTLALIVGHERVQAKGVLAA